MPAPHSTGGRGHGGGRRGGPHEPPPPQSLRERFAALRNVPPFLRSIWQTSRLLTLASVALRLLRALLPVATLYVGKLIVDEVVRLVGVGVPHGDLAAWLRGGQLAHLGLLLGLEFALAVLADLLGRVVALVDSLLGELYANTTSIRLMEHAASLDLEDFEDADLQDQLDRARRQVAGRGSLLSQLLQQAQDVITLLSFAVGLAVYAPWLIVLLAVALVPAFLGEFHFNAQSYAVNYQWTPERRELDYLRMVGASASNAKEVKSFGLNPFLIDRYRVLSQDMYRAN
ncbi:MAG TPA: ABC transporter ATP-binding protein, partial [Dyella sp.]|nr:ABC transporter ATP-binding protein [Dyella sp.]